MALIKDSARTGDHAAEAAAFLSDSATEEVIRGVLGELSLTNNVLRRADVKAATQFVTDNASPQLLIVDVSGSDLPLSDIQNLAKHCEPRVRVVVIGDRNDVGLFRDLITLGVSDYVVKPVTQDLMHRALSKALGRESFARSGERAGKLIAVVGAHGGVGTTTVAANVAWLLSDREGRRVTLVDMDLHFGALGLMLDVKPSRGLREAFESADRIDDLFVERLMANHSERLAVVCGDESLDQVVRYNPAATSKLLDVMQRRSHYVVVDVPRRPEAAFQEVLKRADTRIIIADQTLISARDALHLVRPIEGADSEQRTMLVVNRRAPATKGEVPVEDLERTLEHKVDHIVPYGKGDVAAASNLGDLAAAARGPVTNAMAAIAADLSGGAADTTPAWKKLLRSA